MYTRYAGLRRFLRLRVHDQRHQVARGLRRQNDAIAQVGARDRGRGASRQIGAHHLLDGAVVFTPLGEIRESAIAQEAGVGLALLQAARKLPLIGAIPRHQPDMRLFVARRDVRDGLPIGRHRGHGV